MKRKSTSTTTATDENPCPDTTPCQYDINSIKEATECTNENDSTTRQQQQQQQLLLLQDTTTSRLLQSTNNNNNNEKLSLRDEINVTTTTNTSTTKTSVEDRVRARSLLLQQQEQQRHSLATNGTLTDTSFAATTRLAAVTTSTLMDPQFILCMTDALWSYLITTNFRQKQQQQHTRIGNITRSNTGSSSSIESMKYHSQLHHQQPGRPSNNPAVSSSPGPTAGETAVLPRKPPENTKPKHPMMIHQNFVLKDLVQILRRAMVTSGGGSSTSTSTTFSAVGSNSSTRSTVSKRDIVNALLEIHANRGGNNNDSNIFDNWITLLDPTTMNRCEHCCHSPQQPPPPPPTNNHEIIQPNTIVQINHSISYQTIRKKILATISVQDSCQKLS